MKTNDLLTQAQLDALVNRCLVFVDRNGTIISRDGSPVHANLSMEYKRNGLEIIFSVSSSGMSNGSSRVEVKQGGQIVFEASGKFMTTASNCQSKTYVPGSWEKTVE